jgi:hypothetical protein
MAHFKGNLAHTRSMTRMDCCNVNTRQVHDLPEKSFRNISYVDHDDLSHPFFSLLTDQELLIVRSLSS